MTEKKVFSTDSLGGNHINRYKMGLRANHVQEGRCYTRELDTLGVARDALHFGLKRLERSSAVHHIDAILALVEDRDSARSKGLHEEADVMNCKLIDLVDVYVDDLIVVAAYENYLKAKMLIFGYVVHKIDGSDDTLKKIARKQKIHPIEITSLPEIQEIRKRGVSKDKVFRCLRVQTLDITTIIGQKRYRNALKIPNEVAEKLQEIIQERNKIHYWVVQMVSLSRKRFEDLAFLVEYIRGDANRLLSETAGRFEELRTGGSSKSTT